MSNKANNLPVKVDLGAKAEAKFEVKAEVPSSSVGRTLDAVTDMFRPFSERRGLRADQIRLQREEVAIEIARLARQRAEIEMGAVKPVPNKVLIPLIEKASNEAIDDNVMIDRWAGLLASASHGSGAHPHFVQLLSELTADQALLIERIILNEHEQWQLPDRIFGDLTIDLDVRFYSKFDLGKFAKQMFSSSEELMLVVEDVFNRPGCLLYSGCSFS